MTESAITALETGVEPKLDGIGAESSSVVPAANSGRDASGRFVKGNMLSKGASTISRRVLELRTAAVEAVTRDDVIAIFKKQVERAREGDLPAATFVVSHAVGKPETVAKLQAGDGGPMVKIILGIDEDAI